MPENRGSVGAMPQKLAFIVQHAVAGERIDRVLQTIWSQEACVSLHVHVQDFGTDGTTADRLAARRTAHSRGGGPPLECDGIDISFEACAGRGASAALSEALALPAVADADFVAALPSTSRLLPGACALIGAIAEIDAARDIAWFAGAPSQTDGRAITEPGLPAISTEMVALGLCDGRFAPLLQGAAVVFRPDAARRAIERSEGPGIAEEPAHWDLWRRLASHAPLRFLDRPLARDVASQEAAASEPPGDAMVPLSERALRFRRLLTDDVQFRDRLEVDLLRNRLVLGEDRLSNREIFLQMRACAPLLAGRLFREEMLSGIYDTTDSVEGARRNPFSKMPRARLERICAERTVENAELRNVLRHVRAMGDAVSRAAGAWQKVAPYWEEAGGSEQTWAQKLADLYAPAREVTPPAPVTTDMPADDVRTMKRALRNYRRLADKGLVALAEKETLETLGWQREFLRAPFHVSRWNSLRRFQRRMRKRTRNG